MRSRRLLLIVIALMLPVLGGCGPQWMVVLQAQPDPFVGQPLFAVAPVSYRGVSIGEKSEGEYAAGKSPEQQQSFDIDKEEMARNFMEALVASAHEYNIRIVRWTPQNAPFVIRPTVEEIEPGFYAGVAGAPSKVEMRLLIVTPQGMILDEVRMTHKTPSGMVFAASGTRLRNDGKALGRIAGAYLKSRVVPEK